MVPFGFNANFKDEFIKPLDDIIISSSGPLMNFVFFALFAMIDKGSLARINITLCIFNLIPAEFLDGGRILKNLLKMNASYYAGYITVNICGMIVGVFLMLCLLYYKLTFNGIILFGLGIYIVYICYINRREISINIIKDAVNKQNYIYGAKKLWIKLAAFSEECKILDIVRHFCFNKYHMVYIKKRGRLKESIGEKDMVWLYCSYGNITLKECVELLRTQEVK
jgi:stage IV sporulation protein FB